MYNVCNETTPATIFELFHPYPTGFSRLCYKIPKANLIKCKYRISNRGVLIWNNFLHHSKKQIESLLMKMKLLISKIFCPIKQTF